MARFVSFLVLVAILVVMAIVFFRVMAGFFVPLFLAALLGVIVQPLYRWVLEKCRGYRYASAAITTTLVAIIALLPIGLVVTTATLEGLSLVDRLQVGNVRQRLDELRADFGLQIPRQQDVRSIENVLNYWRGRQRRGEPLEFHPDQVKNLIARVQNIERWLQAEQAAGATVPLADPAPLKAALQQLLIAEPATSDTVEASLLEEAAPPLPAEAEDQSVLQEDALLVADAEFRDFKRNLLGGTYRAWLSEIANPSEDQVDQFRRTVLSTAGSVLEFGGDTLLLGAKIAFGLLIMIVALFFLLAEGSRMLEALIRISPLEEQHVRELVKEFDRVCRAIVSATLLSALAQGMLAGLGFYMCGLRSSVALLTLLTMVLALVPFTGAAAVWIPVSLYLYFFQGSTWAAVGLAIYGGIIVSQADNVIKPLVLHGQSNLHPLLALLSVLGGIQALGPIGILVGPMVVVFLQTLLKILQRELMSLDRSSWMFWRGFGGPAPATVVVTTPATDLGSTVTDTATVDAEPPAAPAAGGNGHTTDSDSDAPPPSKPRPTRRT